jgi:hypothetical protein
VGELLVESSWPPEYVPWIFGKEGWSDVGVGVGKEDWSDVGVDVGKEGWSDVGTDVGKEDWSDVGTDVGKGGCGGGEGEREAASAMPPTTTRPIKPKTTTRRDTPLFCGTGVVGGASMGGGTGVVGGTGGYRR